MKEGFTKLKEYMTQFPIINIYQTQTNLQVGIMDPEASILEYYLEYINPRLSDLFMIVSARQGKSVDKEGMV